MSILTSRTALGAAPASGDFVHLVDVSDTTDNAAGTSKKLTIDNLTSYGDARTATLTNKTINTASNTLTVVEADISDLQSYILADSTDTLTNKTFDANGTGNSLSNVDLTADVIGVLPHANLGSGGGGSTKFLREDSTYQIVSAGSVEGTAVLSTGETG